MSACFLPEKGRNIHVLFLNSLIVNRLLGDLKTRVFTTGSLLFFSEALPERGIVKDFTHWKWWGKSLQMRPRNIGKHGACFPVFCVVSYPGKMVFVALCSMKSV